MKRKVVKTLLWLSLGVLWVVFVRIGDRNGIKIADFIPLAGIAAALIFDSVRDIQKRRMDIRKRVLAINDGRTFAYDNILISKSEDNDRAIKVRNDLFWIDLKDGSAIDERKLLDSLIADFRRLSRENSSFRKVMADRLIEFSLVDNVSFEGKILAQKSMAFSDICR